MPRLALPLLMLFLSSCTAAPAAEIPPSLIYVQGGQLVTSSDMAASAALLDFAPPPGCSIRSLHPAPQGAYLAVLLDCASGPLTLVVDLDSGHSGSPLEEPLDSRFLAWDASGTALYILADTLGEARILRIDLRRGTSRRLPLPGSTYALACSPDAQTLVYAQTPGLGFGSELWTADPYGKNARRLLADPENIFALPRWSPDGRQLAYIRMPDTHTPFPNGELWLLDTTTGKTRFLANADAGHGYAPAWSPDGQFIAFAARTNPDDPLVQASAGNTRSQIHVVETGTGIRYGMSRLEGAQAGTPAWSPDGRFLVFPVWLDGKMNLWAYDTAADETIPLTETGACCPVWIGK